MKQETRHLVIIRCAMADIPVVLVPRISTARAIVRDMTTEEIDAAVADWGVGGATPFRVEIVTFRNGGIVGGDDGKEVPHD